MGPKAFTRTPVPTQTQNQERTNAMFSIRNAQRAIYATTALSMGILSATFLATQPADASTPLHTRPPAHSLHASTHQTKPSYVTYEFVTDPTAAGDLDTYYSDNYDYEADHPEYCTITQVNLSAYGPDALLIKCTVPATEAPQWVHSSVTGPGSPTEYRPIYS